MSFNKIKKICIVRYARYPLCVRVRKESLALVDRGFTVDVICRRDNDEKRKERIKGVTVYRLPVYHRRGGIFRYLFQYLSFFSLAGLKLCMLYFRERYEVIQVNTLPDFLVFAALIPKLLGARVVLDLHEPAPELFGTIFGPERRGLQRIVTFIERMSIRFADHAITVSEQMKNNYIRRGASPSKLSVILNVPNQKEFNPRLYEKYLVNEKHTLSLMCHGHIMKRYGQHVAIRAIALLKDKIPSIRLNITGTGEYESEVRRLVADLKLEEHVRFQGMLPIEDLIEMMAKTDIGIVPVEKNPYSDLVHTNKMFEFIAMRKPVIISRTKAVEEYFGPDDTCLKYFKSDDERELALCIEELYNDPGKGERMARKAYEKYMSASWEQQKEDYCRLFE